MASPYQVRASINKWLQDNVTLNDRLTPADRIVFEGVQGQQPNEWHVSWDAEREGRNDQDFSRIFQVTRSRADGSENGLEMETAALMTTLGLDKPGRGAAVTVYDYPDSRSTAIGTAIVRRFRDKGWAFLQDPGDRPKHIRSAITLQVDFTP